MKVSLLMNILYLVLLEIILQQTQSKYKEFFSVAYYSRNRLFFLAGYLIGNIGNN